MSTSPPCPCEAGAGAFFLLEGGNFRLLSFDGLLELVENRRILAAFSFVADLGAILFQAAACVGDDTSASSSIQLM